MATETVIRGKKEFGIFKTIGEGATLFEKNISSLFLPLVVFWVILLLITLLPLPFLPDDDTDPTPLASIAMGAAYIFQAVVGFVIHIGIINLSFRVIDGKSLSVGDLFSKSNLLISIVFCAILVGLGISIGTLLLIIPGFIFAVKTCLSYYPLVDKELGAIESIKRSWNMTRGCFWKVFFLIIVLAIINLIAALLLFVPVLFTAPMTIIILALTSRKLENQTYVTTPEVILPPTTPLQQ